MTCEQISQMFGLIPSRAESFLSTLVACNMMQREGEGSDTFYSNTPSTSLFMDEGKSETYVGGLLSLISRRLYAIWNSLPEALRTGEKQNEGKDGGVDLFTALYDDQERMEVFLEGMMGVSSADFHSFAEKFDFSKFKTLVDVGGATGQLSSMVALSNSHLSCGSADLPAVVPVAEKWIKKWGVDDRVKAMSLDFLKEDFPNADVITMSRILHDWNLSIKMYDAYQEVL